MFAANETHAMICASHKTHKNSRSDADVQEDEPAEAKFSDDEEEQAYLREQKKNGTAANAQVISGFVFNFAFFLVLSAESDVFSANYT